MFKCMNGLAPKYLSDKFIRRSDVHSRNTRNKSKLNTPMCKSATGQRSFVYRATTIWNNLPDDMRNIQDLNVFIRSNTKMLFNKRLQMSILLLSFIYFLLCTKELFICN